MKNKNYLEHLYDIKWWIFLFFLVGLENIDAPPLDMHAWRQTLTIMISKNFYEIDSNIFFPRTDIGGATEGIMATEFPIFNYILSIFYQIFGFQDWYGRLFNWVVSNLAVLAFYQVLKRAFGHPTAFLSALVYMISITFIYARKTMPDTFSLSLVIIAVNFAWLYLEHKKWSNLLFSTVLFTMGILSKIPSICFAAILLIPILNNLKEDIKPKLYLIGAWAAGCLIMLAWYFLWMPYLLETYKNQLIWPVSLAEGWTIFLDRYKDVHYRFHQAFHSYYFFVFSVAGSALILWKEKVSVRLFFLGYCSLFLLFILKTGEVFPSHDYYVIPITPLMALAIGYFFHNIPISIHFKTILLLVLMWPAFSYKKEKSFREPDTKYYLTIKEIVNEYIPNTGKIMVNGGQFNPTLMYFTGRRGWTVNNDILTKVDWMPDFKRDGLTHILQDRRHLDDLLPYELVFENSDIRIYKM